MSKTFSGKKLTAVSASLVLGVLFLAACTQWLKPAGSESAEASIRTASEKAPALPMVPVVKVKQQTLRTTLELPGQLLAFQDVPIHAKEKGFVSAIYVDRGSVVHKGQLMAIITAPEMDERVKESQAKLSAAEAALSQAESAYQSMVSKKAQDQAKLEADKLTYDRLEQASKTPGAIAQNEVDLAQKAVESDKAMLASVSAEVLAAAHVVGAQKNNVVAARNVVASEQALVAYLHITAPFDGVVTERNVHVGSIVAGDASRGDLPMLRVQQRSLLRLVVAVPEACVSGLKTGGSIDFTVPAFLGKTFTGTIARLGYALDDTTRTMPVELNVYNDKGELEPGMFATVQWIVTRPYQTLFVPPSAVTTDLKNTFVTLVENGVAKRVPVTRGQQMGNLVEIVGDLHEGDTVALKATDEIKSGTRVDSELADAAAIETAGKHTSAGGE